tara:strand:+ start:26254 stop:27132 length:879 start_codon:yes stop_codon:yes gene_type:complete
MGKKSLFKARGVNTFIGAMGAVVTTPTALAARLSIVSGNIHNFSIDANNNISCYIGRNYSSINNAFAVDPYQNNLTYYIDMDGRFTSMSAGNCFNNATNPAWHKVLVLPGLVSCARSFSGGGAGTRNKHQLIAAPKLTPIGASGTTSDNAFSWTDYFGYVYVDSSNQTSNGGAPDPDIAAAISTGTAGGSMTISAAIKYATNLDKPGIVTGISTVLKTATTIEIDWTALTHTNVIDYYLIFVDGEFIAKPTAGPYTITGLVTATTYQIKILAIDEMGNASPYFSNIYTETTS